MNWYSAIGGLLAITVPFKVQCDDRSEESTACHYREISCHQFKFQLLISVLFIQVTRSKKCGLHKR